MKKTLSRSLLAKAQAPRSDTGNKEIEGTNEPRFKKDEGLAPPPSGPNVGGAGSAWKAGAAEQNRTALAKNREKTIKDILEGRHVLMIDPAQVVDRIGTDRRKDWQQQEAFQSLRASIKQNGQDTPIQVWPA